jgi:uncharacterized protein
VTSYWEPLAGGVLIGSAAALLFIANGQIAGVSGIAGRLVGGRWAAADVAFITGLVLGPLLYGAFAGHAPRVTIVGAWPTVVIAGLLVGLGTRMGSGCTSGHGVLGLARLSRRSFAATATFLAAGIAVATLSRFFR